MRLLLFWDQDQEWDSVGAVSKDLVRTAADQAIQELQSWYESHSLEMGNERMETLLSAIPVIKVGRFIQSPLSESCCVINWLGPPNLVLTIINSNNRSGRMNSFVLFLRFLFTKG